MERDTRKNGLVNLVMLLLAALAAYGTGRYGNSLAGEVSALFMLIGVLVAAVSWFQMRLEERERVEKFEFDELSRSAASSALFTAAEAEVFPAQRSREQFEKFFVPAFTLLLFLLQAAGAVILWRALEGVIPTGLNQPATSMGVLAATALLLFLIGKFSSTVARLEGLRLLRPAATYLLLSAYLCGLVVLGIIGVQFGGFPNVDLYLARGLSVVLGLVAVETLLNLILEMYRPRVKGKVERPVYESRLVSLLGQPEGLITTAAQTLDYQFGFKVSETWFYRFLEQALPLLALGQAVLLILSTTVVSIEPGEQALLERFGRPVPGGEVLQPGLHGKLPWPIDQVHRYATEQIQTFVIGAEPDPKAATNRTALWTVAHAGKESNFLVATRETGMVESATNGTPGGDGGQKRTPPVSLLSVSIPVQFQITNITEWAYVNEDPSGLLNDIATREIVRFLVSADVNDIMSRGRWEAATALRDRIQAEADHRKLGARIVFVGLQDIHPPVKVAPDYEKVVAVTLTREAMILAARAEEIRTNASAYAQASNTVSVAQSDGRRRVVDAASQAALFTNQIPAFLASPSVYAQRAYLQTFARSVAPARKYVLLTTNTQDVISLSLEDKISKEYLDSVTIPPPKK